MDYDLILEEVKREMADFHDSGEVANYIPELGKVSPEKFGVSLSTIDQQISSFGDHNEKFSIQSICKVLALTLAYKIEDGELWNRVGVEPSGDPFNSLVQLEYDNGVPRNPMINAGAIVICDILMSHFDDPKAKFIDFVRSFTGNSTIDYSERIANSEKLSGFRNYAVASFMKSFKNIHHDVDEVLDFYFHVSSVEMTCDELARTFLFLANNGVSPATGERIIDESQSKRLNAIMLTCGFYDEAGEFAFRVGLPGKSGVGGGIVAIHPDTFSIAIWSPRLNAKGNSSKGMRFLEILTTKTGCSIF